MKPNEMKLALEGRFRFVAIRPDGTERVLSDWGQNLILDAGLNRLGTGGVWDTCRVGSGNAEPAVGQTSLATAVASTTTVQSTAGGTAGDTTYAWVRRVYRFAAGVAAGNLSEVGVGWTTGLFSRALIKDGLGDPTTITVLSDEVLDVSYEVRAYPVLTDQVFTVPISGVDYTFTVRPISMAGDHTFGGWATALSSLLGGGQTGLNGNALSVNAYASNAALAARTASAMTGTLQTGPGGSTPSYRTAYVNNSYTRACRVSFALNQGTAALGGFLFVASSGLYQAVASPVIPKDNTKTFSLDFSVSWARR